MSPMTGSRSTHLLAAALLFILAVSTANISYGQENYPADPASSPKNGVPKGTVTKHEFSSSKVYPGTVRDYYIYVPAQYREDQPAALMVFQDGRNYVNEKGSWRVPTVFDNLIAAGEMPVTIAVCVNPGVVPGGDDAQDRFNRSYEYDSVSDRYASFIVDELLAEVGKQYSITDDPNRRAIGGASSGAIAAFGVAWHRPDQFRRVFSTIGTYVGLRGGNEYPSMIRHSEPKPLRVFLQDGSNDLNIYGGSWWNANLTMLSALEWAGYDVKNVWGEGGHNGRHGGAILPEAMRWLWADFDKPIQSRSVESHPELKQRLIQGEDWELVSKGHKFTEGLAVAPDNAVYFADTARGEIWKVNADGKGATKFADNLPSVAGLMFDADGNLYCAQYGPGTITKIDSQGSRTTVASAGSCNDLVVLDHGIYFTDSEKKAVMYVPHGGEARKVGSGPSMPNGIITTPDQRFLLVADYSGHYVWSFRIEDDGNLAHGQPYSYVLKPRDELRTDADGVTMTKDGQLVVATKLGIQIFDQPGRSHVILSRPERKGMLTNCVLAGEEMDTLYITLGGSVYKRKTRLTGIAPWQAKVAPPKPRL